MRAKSALCVAILVSAACGDATAPEPSPDGVYVLRSVAGERLPYVLLNFGQDRIEITEGGLTLHAEGTCELNVTFRVTEGGVQTTETATDGCTWTLEHRSFRFTYEDGSHASGSWSGDTVTMVSGPVTFVFVRS